MDDLQVVDYLYVRLAASLVQTGFAITTRDYYGGFIARTGKLYDDGEPIAIAVILYRDDGVIHVTDGGEGWMNMRKNGRHTHSFPDQYEELPQDSFTTDQLTAAIQQIATQSLAVSRQGIPWAAFVCQES